PGLGMPPVLNAAADIPVRALTNTAHCPWNYTAPPMRSESDWCGSLIGFMIPAATRIATQVDPHKKPQEDHSSAMRRCRAGS
ncbi:MAG: hypothetical protein ACRDNS_10575, partial [Trebonia sp.]